MTSTAWKTAWAMLSSRERKLALLVLAVSVAGGLAQVLMISSIMPFLSYVSHPGKLETSQTLNWLFHNLKFQDPYMFAIFLGACSAFIILFSNSLLLLRTYMISRFTVMRIHSISAKLLRSYLARPYEYFVRKNNGDITKRILSETNEIAFSFFMPAAELVSSVIASVFILSFLLYVAPVATFVGGGIVVTLYAVIFKISNKHLKFLGDRRSQANEKRFLAISEVFAGIKEVKINSKEAVYIQRFDRSSREMLKANWMARLASELPRFIVQALFFCGIIVACMLLIDPEEFRKAGDVVGNMVPVLGVFAFAGQRIVPELQRAYGASSKMSFGAAAIHNVYSDMLDHSDADHSPSVRHGLARNLDFNGVTYAYPGAPATIRNMSLRVSKGEKIGIVGTTGAGKTTFVDLILGLLSPQDGLITVDDTPLTTQDHITAWRASIGYVPQSIFLADATLADNITFGAEGSDHDPDRLNRALTASHLTDVVRNLPEGIQTMVGEGGASLSGGQRQRVGLARALYKEPDLLVLDEATSALDPVTERAVVDTIFEQSETTVVMIAHRMDILSRCDRILVLDKGQIIAQGTWDELAASSSEFQNLAKIA